MGLIKQKKPFYKKWYLIVIFILLFVILFQECDRKNSRKSYKKQLKVKDSIISLEKKKLKSIRQDMDRDSIYYEKQKKHIEEIRSRYPNDILLDSLLIAAQRLRDSS